MKINKLKFHGKNIGVVITPKLTKSMGKEPYFAYDLEVTGWKGKMSGEDYQCLKNYLQAEGYIEQAYLTFNE